jgi:hypothetical protein
MNVNDSAETTYDLFWGTIPEFACRNWEMSRTLARMSDVRAARTANL